MITDMKTKSCALAALLLIASHITAQEDAPASLLAHWPMDGGAADAAGSFSGVLASRDGIPEPVMVEGRKGQAVQFGSHTAFEVPLNLDPISRPVITFSFWVKRQSNVPSKGELYIMNTGGDGPRITMRNDRLRIKAGNKAIHAKAALTPDQWHFIAVTWDRNAGSVSLFQDNRETYYDIGYTTRTPQPSYISPRDPNAHLGSAAKKRYLWIGARDGLKFGSGASGVVIDDVHLFEGRASYEQLAELSDGWTNGKLEQSTPFSGLEALPVDQLEQIRQLQVPGGQYDADGTRLLPGDQFEPVEFPSDLFSIGEDETDFARRDPVVAP